jgi:hypothetical protein
MTPTLAIALALLTHPVGLLLALTSVGIVGMALLNFGTFTQAAAQQLISAFDLNYSTFLAAVVAGVIPANVLTGGLNVSLNSASTVPGNQTTRTAAQLFADLAAQWGLPLSDPSLANGISYLLTITQTGAGTLTLVGGTGVTVSGTATVPTNTTRTWRVNLQPTTATFTPISVGTYS